MSLKKALIGVLAFVLVAAAALFLWARAVLAGDSVRAGVEGQLTKTLGQPVSIGSAHATIFPRVTMNLNDVAIGDPARITIARLDVGTDLGALLSRRIEHAAIRLAGARVDLPLPAFAFLASAPAGEAAAAARPPVEIVSIDTITFTDVQIVSGGRTLRGDVDVVPVGAGLRIGRVALEAEGTELEITGEIADLAGPTGDLDVKAKGLNVLELLVFVTDFSRGAGIVTSAAPATRDRAPMDLRLSLDAGRAIVGTLALDALTARARLTPEALTLDPASFGVFGGKYAGTLAWTLGTTPAFSLKASLSGVDVSQAMAYAGSSGAVTGRLSGSLAASGRGTTAEQAVSTARGTARIDLTDGTVKGLGLVRAVVLATSGRAGAPSVASVGQAQPPEPFSRLGATFSLGGGIARTSDLRFESRDVLLSAAGTIALLSQAVNLSGRVQLSEALSAQSGRDLVRYTAEQGRVTLPVTITGSAGAFKVTPDIGEAARRAITRRAEEEAKKLLKRIIK